MEKSDKVKILSMQAQRKTGRNLFSILENWRGREERISLSKAKHDKVFSLFQGCLLSLEFPPVLFVYKWEGK